MKAATLQNNEEYFGSPPSIFLQTPSKKSRKSMTESIFHENEEEEEGIDEQKPISRKNESKTEKTDKTLNDLEMENDEEEDDEEDYDEDSDKKSKLSITGSAKESARLSVSHNFSANHSKKDLRSYQKFFSERESKMLSEKDTFHVLQNFEKMYRVNNGINTGTNQMNTLTAQVSNTMKKNVVSSIMGSYSMSKSNSSSYMKGRNLVKNPGKNPFFSTNNRKPQYSEYLNFPLFAFDFDLMKEYKVFMPHNNMQRVVEKVKVDGLLRGGKLFEEGGSMKKKSLRSSNIANTSFSSKKKPSLKNVKEDQGDDEGN